MTNNTIHEDVARVIADTVPERFGQAVYLTIGEVDVIADAAISAARPHLRTEVFAELIAEAEDYSRANVPQSKSEWLRDRQQAEVTT